MEEVSFGVSQNDCFVLTEATDAADEEEEEEGKGSSDCGMLAPVATYTNDCNLV